MVLCFIALLHVVTLGFDRVAADEFKSGAKIIIINKKNKYDANAHMENFIMITYNDAKSYRHGMRRENGLDAQVQNRVKDD